jgi:hypothetical protein
MNIHNLSIGDLADCVGAMKIAESQDLGATLVHLGIHPKYDDCIVVQGTTGKGVVIEVGSGIVFQ